MSNVYCLRLSRCVFPSKNKIVKRDINMRNAMEINALV